jgi:hypothetical protein
MLKFIGRRISVAAGFVHMIILLKSLVITAMYLYDSHDTQTLHLRPASYND